MANQEPATSNDSHPGNITGQLLIRERRTTAEMRHVMETKRLATTDVGPGTILMIVAQTVTDIPQNVITTRETHGELVPVQKQADLTMPEMENRRPAIKLEGNLVIKGRYQSTPITDWRGCRGMSLV